MKELTYQTSLIVCDDYGGNDATHDIFYAENKGYENNKLATPRVETEKHGVKAAVDEFLEQNKQFIVVPELDNDSDWIAFSMEEYHFRKKDEHDGIGRPFILDSCS